MLAPFLDPKHGIVPIQHSPAGGKKGSLEVTEEISELCQEFILNAIPPAANFVGNVQLKNSLEIDLCMLKLSS